MRSIKTVGVIAKPGAERAVTVVPDLMEWLRNRNVEIRYDQETAAYANLPNPLPRPNVPDGAQLVIVLGGDGTLISAARAIAGREIPLFAVNIGGLGFMTAITVDELFPELERAFRGEHRIGLRRMLHGELWRRGERVASYEALNDIVITKSSLARMIDLETHVDNHFVCSYKADGLIVATPTGSTAYSLSAGGPIIFPSVAALAITPICPHMLTNRPVIVADSSVIQIVSQAKDGEAYLTIDGQVGEPLRMDDRVVCRSSTNVVYLIRPPKMLYFDVLRAKLKWGER